MTKKIKKTPTYFQENMKKVIFFLLRYDKKNKIKPPLIFLENMNKYLPSKFQPNTPN